MSFKNGCISFSQLRYTTIAWNDKHSLIHSARAYALWNCMGFFLSSSFSLSLLLSQFVFYPSDSISLRSVSNSMMCECTLKCRNNVIFFAKHSTYHCVACRLIFQSVSFKWIDVSYSLFLSLFFSFCLCY